MEYSLHELCQLSGVSARTLRYYDEIGRVKAGTRRCYALPIL